jgi:hypothetical protein
MSTFNSLSRDHSVAWFLIGFLLATFNSLSRDHLLHVLEELSREALSTPSLGITSLETREAPSFRTRALSTPSLGITGQGTRVTIPFLL